jgi:ribosome-associated toxin RatA of RatAB toxin-antitoxin module
MFDLVNDFESYPEFLPGCRHARVIEHEEGRYLIGEMTLGKGSVEQTLATRNDLYPHERIELSLAEGPFKRLNGRWLFTPMGESACRVSLEMEFEFSNRLLGMAFGKLFQQVAGQLVDAFTRRADALYGPQ